MFHVAFRTVSSKDRIVIRNCRIELQCRSLSESCHSTAANDRQASGSFSARKNPQRIPANTLPVFSSLRPRICQHLVSLATKDYSDRLLAPRFRRTERRTHATRAPTKKHHARQLRPTLTCKIFIERRDGGKT